MNYEEKLRLAKEALASGSYDKETIEYIFPELRESEDERIRKAIFKSLSKKDARDVLLANGIQVSDALAWLEKQGEQKPTWSEEDEKIILSLHHALNCADAQNAVTKTGVEVADVAQWLSDCKERFVKPNHWKPSKEQLQALFNALPNIKDNVTRGQCISLYNDLKNL